MKKSFLNPQTNKKWEIEVDGNCIKTCLNNGKVKEIICNSNYQLKSKSSSAMVAQMKKGFVYYNEDAPAFMPITHVFLSSEYTGFMCCSMAFTKNNLVIHSDYGVVGVYNCDL